MTSQLFTRRDFIKKAATGAVVLSQSNLIAAATISPKVSSPTIIDWSHGMKPLYCLAYIDPLYKPHQGQESFIAKYPIAVIPQGSIPRYTDFRNNLRKLNPQQKVLAYQVTLDENELLGPGHDQLFRKLKNSWLTLPGGIVPTISVKSAGKVKKFRIYDPRDLTFRKQFVEVCKVLVNQNGFDGIFFDNCTIYSQFINIPILGKQLVDALQQLILEVRSELPNALLIGNSRYNFKGLNGEMNENRSASLAQEVMSLQGRGVPSYDMYHYYMKNSNDLLNAEYHFRYALANRCFFGTGINPQTIGWYPFFDKVLSQFQIV
ncbi:MAG: putative glycoside hydrolase [Methylococcales bacterium]